MKRPLKNHLQDKLNNIELSDEQLAHLNAIQHDAPRKAPPAAGTPWWRQPFAVAAALLVLTVTLLIPGVIDSPQQNDLVAEIADEVVRNHLHLKPLEVESDRLERVTRYFTRLDFIPVGSEFLAGKELQLLGGRYCSLRGVTAAQLRYESVDGDTVHTLYEVGYDPEIFKSLPDYDREETPVTVYAKGVKVTLWVEKGVLFALTED